MSNNRGWYGVDLDGTLAEYHGWVSPDHIGDPIPAMVSRVRDWLGMGFGVKVFTARAFGADEQAIKVIQDWTEEHIGVRLPVTCQKDYGMIQLWDDRAVEVEENTGVPVAQSLALDALAAETQAADAYAAQLKAEAALADFQRHQQYRYIGRDGKPVLARDLEDRAERAEAMAAKPAEALRITRGKLSSIAHSEFDGVWSEADFADETKEADAALAEYEASK